MTDQSQSWKTGSEVPPPPRKFNQPQKRTPGNPTTAGEVTRARQRSD